MQKGDTLLGKSEHFIIFRNEFNKLYNDRSPICFMCICGLFLLTACKLTEDTQICESSTLFKYTPMVSFNIVSLIYYLL